MIPEPLTRTVEVECAACGEIGTAIGMKLAQDENAETRWIEPPYGWLVRGDLLICRCGHPVQPSR